MKQSTFARKVLQEAHFKVRYVLVTGHQIGELHSLGFEATVVVQKTGTVMAAFRYIGAAIDYCEKLNECAI